MTNEDAIKVLEMVECHGSLTQKAKEMAISALKENKGEWIHSFYSEDDKDVYKCSKCGRFIILDKSDNLSNYPYCHCGADMRGKSNE